MSGYAQSPNDICENCQCPRWRHKSPTNGSSGHCRRCGSVKCRQFKRQPREKVIRAALNRYYMGGGPLFDLRVGKKDRT